MSAPSQLYVVYRGKQILFAGPAVLEALAMAMEHADSRIAEYSGPDSELSQSEARSCAAGGVALAFDRRRDVGCSEDSSA
jgi:hypothetical protein